jgi:hypothetical protein
MNKDLILELFSQGIPCIKKKYNSFFEITKYPHYEEVLSNVYAFFLNPKEEHNLSYLFIEALLSFFPGRKVNYTYFDIEREYRTKKGKRIDLLIINNDPNGFAFIIENKIKAPLYNDLVDYWKSIELPENKKIGVVFSINKINTNNENYICITHFDFIEALEKIIGKYISNASERHLILIKELINNIKNMYWDKNMNEEIDFYFKNKEKFIEARDFIPQIWSYIDQKILNFANKMNLEKGAPRSYNYKYIYLDEKYEYSFTIYFESLFTKEDNRVQFILEYFCNDQDKLNQIRTNETLIKKYMSLNFKVWHTPSHVAYIEKELSVDEIKKLDEYLEIIYKNEIEPLYLEIKNGA